jgi:Cu-Zn family superoxide dismutase
MRKSIAAAGVLLLTLAGVRAQQPGINQYQLPAALTYPEGIAYDPKDGSVYVGSGADSALARLTIKGSAVSAATIVSPAGAALPVEPFPALLGMQMDGTRLWLAGGRTGKMAVINARDGKVLKQFETPAKPAGLINDVAVAGSAAYFTDTLRPTLWRVAVKGDQIGDLEPWLEFKGTPLEYGDGPNLNGIAATPDGRHLIVVQMNKGLLFRIAVADKTVTAIDTAGEALNTGDGLVLDGRTLYVVRQGEQEIVTLDLSADLSKAVVKNRFKDPALLWPATAVKVGSQLLVVNTQFNKRNSKDPVTPFSIIGVPLSRLAGK